MLLRFLVLKLLGNVNYESFQMVMMTLVSDGQSLGLKSLLFLSRSGLAGPKHLDTRAAAY